MNKPIICFTSDVDWADEEVIKYTIDLFKKYETPITFFVTHKSKVIEKYCKKKDLGIHPNFMKGSTQGNNYKSVIKHCLKLVTNTKWCRSHGYYENTSVLKEIYNQGIRNDFYWSNMESDLMPYKHFTGITRYPVFFDDSVYLRLNKEERKRNIELMFKLLSTQGLKIFDFHPIHIYLNTPSQKYYENFKKHYDGKDIDKFVFKGKGIRTLLIELLRCLK